VTFPAKLARPLSIAAVGAALVVVACGGSSNATSSSSSTPSPSPSAATGLITGSIDACKLVTATDATNVMGVTMTAFGSSGGAPVCIYAGQLSDGTSASVFVYAQSYPDASQADAVSPDQMAAAFRGQFGITDAKAVSGLGDKAFEYTATSANGGGSGVVIFVFKANVVLFVAVSPTTDATKAESLAHVAVGNLPKS
jgi:hypothetical protein